MTLSLNATQTLGCIVFFSALTFINLVFFQGYQKERVRVKCTSDKLMVAAAEYFLHGGENITAYLPPNCNQPRQDVLRELNSAVGVLINNCQMEAGKSKEFKTYPILTLFTSHSNHKHGPNEKFIMHNNTLHNWGTLRPKINLILFSNDEFWGTMATKSGWTVLPLLEKSPSQAPVLKSMFEAARKKYDTPWYGYANADLLFLDDFLPTLEGISLQYGIDKSMKRILISGQRTNVKSVSFQEVTSFAKLRMAATSRGSLGRIDAEDFFIATNSFPWSLLPPVVVGRPAYDNWLISHSKCSLNTTVIDVTNTMTVVHQSVTEELDQEWPSPELNYNSQLLEGLNKTLNYVAGITSCIDFTAFHSLCGSLRVSIRRSLGANCLCVTK